MPTTSIVIGYGAYGREVLRRLLVSSAGRGVLSWEEAEGGQDPALRRLRGWGLVWVPDLPGLGGSSQDTESLGSGVFGVLDDLYRQIDELAPGPRMGEALTEVLDTQARSLLRASSRTARSEDAPLMLNVILVAQPTRPEVVGALNDLISGGMERLASYPNLQRPQEGGDLLNFIQLLDFDHFWAEGQPARNLRRAVRLSVNGWQKRSQEGRPGYGRIYLADSYTSEGVRDARHRLDELVLFLELLLFETRQAGLEVLYRRQRDLLSPLAGFGVRAVEQNTELLSRLAAARFAQAWLHYLAEEQPQDTPSAGLSQLRDLLAPYRSEALPELLAEEELRQQVETDFDALGQELTEIPLDLPEWGSQLRRRCREGIGAIQDELFQRSGARLIDIRQSTLEPFPEKLGQAVTSALQHASEPATLAQVIHELEQAAQEVQPSQPPPMPPPPREEDPVWEELDAYQARFRDFKSTQVAPQMHRRRWPLLISMLFAASLTPLMARAIAHWKDSGNYLLEAFYGWLSPPYVMLPLLLLLSFLVAFLAVPPLLRQRTRRGLRFFSDSERGRGAALIRQLLAPGNPLRAPLDAALERRVYDFSYSVRGFVAGEVERTLQSLRQRRREMLWLRGQLSEYSRIHATEPASGQPGPGRSAEMGPAVLQLESATDLERILDYNPPRRQRFRSTQSQVLLFEDWQQRFSRSFLYPLQFLDGPLSKIYRERSRQEQQESEGHQAGDQRRNRMASSIERQCRFDVGFHWPAGEKVPEENRYALLPPEWARQAEVEGA
ncbi:MAG: hypothetical protein V3T83_00630, partial [Acidobacteriota bacterium]